MGCNCCLPIALAVCVLCSGCCGLRYQQPQPLVAVSSPVYVQPFPMVCVCDPWTSDVNGYDYCKPNAYSAPAYAMSSGDVAYTTTTIIPPGTKQSGAVAFSQVGSQFNISGTNAVKAGQVLRDAVNSIYENDTRYTTTEPYIVGDVITLRTNELRRTTGDFAQHTIVFTVNSQQEELEIDVYSELFSKQGNARVARPGGAPPEMPQRFVDALEKTLRGEPRVDIVP